MSMAGKVCIVTGANVGIGKATAEGLARKGATIVLACRNLDKGQAALDEIQRATKSTALHVMALDLASQASIRAFARAVEERFDRLDVLVNNAGLITRRRQLTADGLEAQLGVNHLGPFLLTRLLLPLLERSAPSRVVVVSSGAHWRGRIAWDDLQATRGYAFRQVYAQSKLANLLFVRALARRTKGVTVNGLHPGVIATEIARDMPLPVRFAWRCLFKSPEEGALTPLHLATSPQLDGVTGKYFEECRQVRPAPAALDDAAAERLWTISEELTGLTSPSADRQP